MKVSKNTLKIIFIVFVMGILVSGMSVYATYNYLAKDVKYTKPDGTETDVEKSLNELYQKINTKKLTYDIVYSNQDVGINKTYDYKISEKDLKYKNIMIIVNSINTAQNQSPTEIVVTCDKIITISNDAPVTYTEYGIYTTGKLYIGIIENIVKDDVINIKSTYGSKVLILGIE